MTSHAKPALSTPSAQLTTPLHVTHAPTASTASPPLATVLHVVQEISQSAPTATPAAPVLSQMVTPHVQPAPPSDVPHAPTSGPAPSAWLALDLGVLLAPLAPLELSQLEEQEHVHLAKPLASLAQHPLETA